jgi:hypothetical protein
MSSEPDTLADAPHFRGHPRVAGGDFDRTTVLVATHWYRAVLAALRVARADYRCRTCLRPFGAPHHAGCPARRQEEP